MKKLILFSAVLILGVASSFAYTSGGWSYSCPYMSTIHETVTCNLPTGTRVFVRTDCSKNGTAAVMGTLAEGITYTLLSSSYQGVKEESWIDEVTYYRDGQFITVYSNWVSFRFELVNPYSGPNYWPGSCYAHVLIF